ncbi:MAG: hypothetical protein ACREJQ_06855 [bacterium]
MRKLLQAPPSFYLSPHKHTVAQIGGKCKPPLPGATGTGKSAHAGIAVLALAAGPVRNPN